MNQTNDAIQKAMAELENVDDEIRAQAIEALGEHQYTAAVPSLIEIMHSADPGTRFITVKALGRIADARAVPVLLDALQGDDIWTRAAAAGALISIGSPAVEGLTGALRHEKKAVRRAAAKALGKIGENGKDEGALRALSAALLDVDDGVRRFAAEAIGRLGAEGMVPELKEVLADNNAEVRIAAFRALANIDTPEAQKAVRSWLHE